MPEMAAQEEVRKKRLVRLNWQGLDFPVYAQIFIHRDKHVSRAIRDLAEMIAEEPFPEE